MDHYYIGEKHRNTIENSKRKSEGIYYTPPQIVDLMIDKIIEYYKKKGYSLGDCKCDLKILDIASGCGYFYFELINKLFGDELNHYFENTQEEYTEYKNIDFVYSKLKNIYSIEKDTNSANTIKYIFKAKYKINDDIDSINNNILNEDALFFRNGEIKEGTFDMIIGNPPYVGHKDIPNDYSNMLRLTYDQVYKDKSDLYYCFFKIAIDLLKDGGICSYIVPRYFLEAQSAKYLRDYLRENARIISIYDIRSSNVFSNYIGISSCIITFQKISEKISDKEFSNTDIFIIDDKYSFEKLLDKEVINSNGKLIVSNHYWHIATNSENIIINKIKNKKNKYRLRDFVICNQGIITGCDKAFIFEKKSDVLDDIDDKHIKKWVKSKNIRKYFVESSDKVIAYTNDMTIEDVKGGFLKHLGTYKEKLLTRREVLSGTRKWYELQWGRNSSLFNKTKIVFPYKCKENRFALDKNSVFFSADIYSIVIKDEYKGIISYEYLLALLNSKVYEKYMQSFLKKMGKDIVEYYPYLVLDTWIFIDDNYEEIEQLSIKIINENILENRKYLQEKLDKLIFSCLEKCDKK